MTLNVFPPGGIILAQPYVAPVHHMPLPQICPYIMDQIVPTHQNQNNRPTTTFLDGETYDEAESTPSGYYVQESSDSEPYWVWIDHSLSEKFIAKYLKTRKFNEVVRHNEEEQGICVVCQDDLGQENDRTIGVLDCGHQYHDGCIRRWLTQKNVCPLCKAIGLNVGDREWEKEEGVHCGIVDT